MKFWANLLVFMAGVGLAAGAAFGGDLEPAAPPGSTSGYTMDDLYNRLRYGTDVSPQTFTEPGPVYGPITGAVRTVDEVMAVAPERDDDLGARAKDVQDGKTFWGLTIRGWGLLTGTFVEPTAPAPVAETGQKISYAAGDDGDLQIGVPLPSPRFTDNEDGTVTDNKTELIWLKNADCFGTRNWATALEDCNTLASGACDLRDGSLAGDWRLPNIREIRSLINSGYYYFALSNTDGTSQWTEGNIFNNVGRGTAHRYWSSTSWVGDSSIKWHVDMANGEVEASYATAYHRVWPIRGGQ